MDNAESAWRPRSEGRDPRSRSVLRHALVGERNQPELSETESVGLRPRSPVLRIARIEYECDGARSLPGAIVFLRDCETKRLNVLAISVAAIRALHSSHVRKRVFMTLSRMCLLAQTAGALARGTRDAAVAPWSRRGTMSCATTRRLNNVRNVTPTERIFLVCVSRDTLSTVHLLTFDRGERILQAGSGGSTYHFS